MIFHISCLYLCKIEPLQKLVVRLGACKTGLSPTPTPVIYITDRSKAIIMMLFCLFYVLVSNKCLCCFNFVYVFIYIFSKVRITEWSLVGK